MIAFLKENVFKKHWSYNEKMLSNASEEVCFQLNVYTQVAFIMLSLNEI